MSDIKETKVIKIKVTKTKTRIETLGVTKVLVEVIRGRTYEGVNATRLKGDSTRLPTCRDQIKVQMITMSIHLTYLIILTLCHSLRTMMS